MKNKLKLKRKKIKKKKKKFSHRKICFEKFFFFGKKMISSRNVSAAHDD